MIGLLQIFGILYLLLMLYMTFLYYKRNNYSWRSFAFWVAVWSAGIVLLLFPQTSSTFTQQVYCNNLVPLFRTHVLQRDSVLQLHHCEAQRTQGRGSRPQVRAAGEKEEATLLTTKTGDARKNERRMDSP